MSTAPVPRFDLLQLNKYTSMSVQFSRGCPFQCEFCDNHYDLWAEAESKASGEAHRGAGHASVAGMAK